MSAHQTRVRPPRVVARNRTTGTEYTKLTIGHNGWVTVTSVAGSIYIVRFDSLELVPGAKVA